MSLIIPQWVIDAYKEAITKQLEAPTLMFGNGPRYGPHQKHDLRPIYGPHRPKRMLVRDLIKQLSAFDPDDEVRVNDCEYGPLEITGASHYEYWESYDDRPIVIVE